MAITKAVLLQLKGIKLRLQFEPDNFKFEKLRNRKIEEKNAQFLAYPELCISINKYFSCSSIRLSFPIVNSPADFGNYYKSIIEQN